ncbi:MAG: hypothetical protein ABS808_02255 [Wolbachia endosymbiont of Polyergus mexicanus]|uniref:Uncharacterized protein n=1 Tax=Wolbachia endosymbiont of Polyergus mexicanus TaxID=3171167 RepID=A0AAU7YJ30_9RICK
MENWIPMSATSMTSFLVEVTIKSQRSYSCMSATWMTPYGY